MRYPYSQLPSITSREVFAPMVPVTFSYSGNQLDGCPLAGGGGVGKIFLIEEHDCPIENGRKADPEEIGYQEIKGNFGERVEVLHRQDDEREESYDGGESQNRGAQSEKCDGPQEIKCQLSPKIIPRHPHFFLFPAQLPNEKKSYTHH